MTSTNVGRSENGGMSVTVTLPDVTMTLANTPTGDDRARFPLSVSTRDARVAEALLLQALQEVRGLGGLVNDPYRGATIAGIKLPNENGETK